nr:myristoylated alanine-rich C-kinase substrate-like [Aegilops tauschii subsp. strangulata]
MPVFNAHGLDSTWAEPKAELVQAFFDNLSERFVRDEPQLIRDTTKEELAYITARAEEAAVAEEAGSLGTVEDEDDVAAEEREFAEWTGSAGEPSSAGAVVPLVEEAVEESAEEETDVDDSVAPGRKRFLWQAGSSEPIRWRRIREAAKSAAEEAAKGLAGETSEAAAGEAGKGPTGETGEAAAGEAGKAAAEEAAKWPAREGVAEDQPSSPAALAPGKYLRVGDDLFIRLPRVANTRAPDEGEVFDDEALATAGLQVVDEPSASGSASQEEQLLRAMSANFQKLQTLHRARQDKVNSRMAAVDKAEADFEERVAQTQV